MRLERSPLIILYPAITPMPRRRSMSASDAVIKPSTHIVELPLVPVRDTVIFPRLVSPITVARDRSVHAVEEAMLRDQRVVVMTQRNQSVQEPLAEDLYPIGTEMSI